MHIALVSPEWPVSKSHNGIVTYVHCLREQFQHMGHKVSVFSLSNTGVCAQERIYPVGAPKAANVLWRVGQRVFRRPTDWVQETAMGLAVAINTLHYQDPIDVVEMEETFGIFGVVKTLISVPLVVKLHGPGFLDVVDDTIRHELTQRRLQDEGAALAAAEAITSPCQHTLDETLRHYRLQPHLARVIFNPIAESSHLPSWDVGAAERDTLLFVGRFDLRKGGDIALRLFKRLREIHPQVKLIFVGPDRGLKTPDGSIDFKSYAESLGLRGDNHLDYRGIVPWEQIGALRTQAMLTLALPRWDNQPNAIMEAMQQGCPVVALDVGGMGEIIRQGESGALIPWDGQNIEPLAQEVSALLRDPAKAERLGRQGAHDVRVNHDPGTVARAILDVYREIVTRST